MANFAGHYSVDGALATTMECQRKVVRNPRGQGYYYAVIQVGDAQSPNGLRLFNSADGVSWTDLATLNTSPHMNIDMLPIDTGSQFEMLLAYATNNDDSAVLYRRIQVPDNTSTPTVGAEQIVSGTTTAGNPVIARDRNGRVHVVYADWTTAATTLNVHIVGSNETTLVDAPTWSTDVSVATLTPGSTITGAQPICLTFGGTGNIGGVMFITKYDESATFDDFSLQGRDIVSFNGTSYVFGTLTEIDFSQEATGSGKFMNLSGVVDSDLKAQIAFTPANIAGVPSQRVTSRKAASASTVQSFAARVDVDTNTDCQSLSVGIDAAGTGLLATYKRSASTSVRYRKSPTGTVAWGAESTVAANAHTNYSMLGKKLSNSWLWLYTETASPWNVKLVEFVDAPPSGTTKIWVYA